MSDLYFPTSACPITLFLKLRCFAMPGEHSAEVIELLMWDDKNVSDPRLQRSAHSRHVQLEMLLVLQRFFSGKWWIKPGRRNGQRFYIVHYCPGWCVFGCTSREHCILIGVELLSEHWLSIIPTIPALNKWLKLLPVSAWNTFGHAFYNILKTIWQLAIKRKTRAAAKYIMTEDDLVALGDEHSYERIQTSRMNKTVRFHLFERTPRHLGGTVLLLKATNGVLGHMFRDSTWTKQRSGVIPLVRKDTPIMALVCYCDELLSNMRHPAFTILRGFDGGPDAELSRETRQMSCNCLHILMSNVKTRGVDVWDLWPWPLAIIPDPLAPMELKRNISHKAKDLWACCGDDFFGLRFAATLHDTESALQPDNVELLHRSFSRCPKANIHTEDRFARTSACSASCKGNFMDETTMMSQHCLAESKSIHLGAVARLVV